MHDIQILKVCLLAFGAVFVLLSFLAIVMRVLVALFPQREDPGSAAVVAAISASVSTLFPGARVTRIEEK